MDGLLNLYKPLGLTSARALDRVRAATGQRRSGHAGTLDPNAEGVLLIVMGKATKCVEGLMGLPKVYRATVRLDLTSLSFDAEKQTTAVAVEQPPGRAAVEAALLGFVGSTEQVPPAVSALKVGGRPAYKLGRRGHALALPARTIHISRMQLDSYEWPTVAFTMCCSRGTYVRALVRDLGVRLGTGGCLMHLLRSAVGPFTSEDATRVEELTAKPTRLVGVERLQAILSEAEALS